MKVAKYQAAGNDFLLIRALPGTEISIDRIIRLCDRRYGIGADGLIILEESSRADFAMRFYNCDGSDGMMCGNGGRCIIDFAHRLGLITGQEGCCYEAPDGLHHGRLLESCSDGSTMVELSMKAVDNCQIIRPGSESSYEAQALSLNTGSPHLVLFCKEEIPDIGSEGRKWRYSPIFAPAGTNVDFVRVVQEDGAEILQVRTYERGVEGETASCGTGIVAAALAYHRKNHGTSSCIGSNSYRLRSRDGHHFEVSFEACADGSFDKIMIKGPVERVFVTEVEL